MSQTRPIWNDGQGLATPDLQRPCDVAGAADDHVYEVLATPGSVQKRVLPLSEESATLNPKLLAIPSAVGLVPAGVSGGVRVMPCELIAGSPSSTQQVSLAATLYAPLDSAAIASGGVATRYDLIYATVNRSVSVTGTRKIKSATDGSLSSQTINLADAPAVTLGINQGFLTGATPPTLAQIAAAVPADTAPSGSTFGSFNFPIAYVTVATTYVAGNIIAQDSTGGTTFLTQCWSEGFLPHMRTRGTRPVSLYAGAANERPGGTLQNIVTGAERWGNVRQFFAHIKHLPTTSSAVNYTGNPILDNSIDWRNRFVWGFYGYLGTATQLPLDGATPAMISGKGLYVGSVSPTSNCYNLGAIPMAWSGAGVATTGDMAQLNYSDGVTAAGMFLSVLASDGSLRFRRSGVVDGTNGDIVAIVLFASDPLKING